MTRLLRPAGSCVLAALFLVAVPSAAQAQAPPPAQTFTVNSTADVADSDTGIGRLRDGGEHARFARRSRRRMSSSRTTRSSCPPAPTTSPVAGRRRHRRQWRPGHHPAGHDQRRRRRDDGRRSDGRRGARLRRPAQLALARPYEIIGTHDHRRIPGRNPALPSTGVSTPRPSLVLTASAVTGNTRRPATSEEESTRTPDRSSSTAPRSAATPLSAGGGISLEDGAVATITNSTISGNTATGRLAPSPAAGAASASRRR